VYNGYIKQPKKEYDFVFGMTSIMSSNNFRPKLIDELLKIDSNHDLKLKLFFKDKQKKINTFVNGFEYNEYISKSRFTLNIPSYDVEEFSMERFLEAIKRNCVPLIHDQCKYKEPLSIYPSILEIVKKDCIVNTSNLVEKLTNIDDVSIINKLKASQDWKNINDLNYYNGYMKKYGEEIFYSDKVISDPYTDVLKKILEFSDEDISYNEKTYKILNSFKELYKNTKFSFNLTNIQILDENIEKFLIYNPFMFYYKKNKRKELMELYLKEIEKLSDEEKFLYGIGNGCTDDGCIIVLGMAPGFYNGTKYDLLSKPYKPSFYFSNTSKILRFGLSKHLDNIYFTNLSKIVYSKERMSNVEYSKLYEKYIQVFLEEIKILKPKQIIALGNNLNEILNKYNIEHITLKHPSYFLYRKNEHNGINYYEEEIKCLK